MLSLRRRIVFPEGLRKLQFVKSLEDYHQADQIAVENIIETSSSEKGISKHIFELTKLILNKFLGRNPSITLNKWLKIFQDF